MKIIKAKKISKKNFSEFGDIAKGQKRLFEARLNSYSKELEKLNERMADIIFNKYERESFPHKSLNLRLRFSKLHVNFLLTIQTHDCEARRCETYLLFSAALLFFPRDKHNFAD